MEMRVSKNYSKKWHFSWDWKLNRVDKVDKDRDGRRHEAENILSIYLAVGRFGYQKGGSVVWGNSCKENIKTVQNGLTCCDKVSLVVILVSDRNTIKNFEAREWQTIVIEGFFARVDAVRICHFASPPESITSHSHINSVSARSHFMHTMR